MKNVFILENLECAHCASKMEEKIKKIKGVREATVNFFSMKLCIECEPDDLADILKEAQKIIKKIEPDCKIKER